MAAVNQEVLQALTSGIQSEIASYVFYLKASEKSITVEFKQMLEKLALEEKEHFQVLERQYDSLVRSEMWISTADILKAEGLPEISEDMTSKHQSLIDEVARADSIAAVLEIAYRLEEEAHKLFDNASKIVDSKEGREMFEHLSKFEQGHMELIARMQKKYA